MKKAISLLLTALVIFTFAGCESAKTAKPHYADKKFIESLSKGLEERWTLTEKYEDEEDTVDMMNSYIQAELDELTQYETAMFQDTKLQEKAIRYINCLKDSQEHIEYCFSGNYEDMAKWDDIYNTRAVLIKDFVENYGLTVSDKYKSTLDSFIATGKIVETNAAQQEAVQKLVDSLEFKVTENDYGWKTYQAILENTSEYDIVLISIDVSLLDESGTIIETGAYYSLRRRYAGADS